jgi:Dolichyl-phosphate-mannose-protein mannosyltransferase
MGAAGSSGGGAEVTREAPPRRGLLVCTPVETALMALAFLAFLGFARWFSTDVPGGADWWGYVSEAARITHGHLYEPESVLSPLGIPEDSGFTEPLGYTSRGRGGTVPVYPFGYPLLMAVAMLLAGHHAAFWVTPILAAAAVLLTYVLGRALLGRAGGAIAALLLALLPNFIWGAIQPLSDVPAAFFCALALVALLAVRRGVAADVLLGVALGLGVWVRPNMALLVAVIGAWLLLRPDRLRLARVSVAVVPFLLGAALVNWHLFGAPWRTGYGALALGGTFAEALARGARHLLRLNAQQGGAGLALLGLALAWNRLTVPLRALLAATFAAFLVFFAFYRIDDAWWYLRFLVPAMPAVVVLEAGFLVRLAGPGRLQRLRVAAVALAVCALALGERRYGLDKRIYTLKEGEQRYPNVARLAARVVKLPAVVLAMQHSGSLRYYAGLPTARYDIPDPATLIDTLLRVARRGGRVYLVADDWELEQIANRGKSFLLAGATPLGHVGPGYTAVFLLDPERAAERLRRGTASRRDPAALAVFDGDGERFGAAWRLRGPAAIALPGDAEPALARVCASGSGLGVRRRGLPAATVAAGSCVDLPLLPGQPARVEIAPLGGGGATAGTVEVLPVAALHEQGLLDTAYVVPQVARQAGVTGSFWQTDILLVNPQTHALRVTGVFLPSGRDNREACAATAVVPAGAALELKDVLSVHAFESLGGLGALLVYAGGPGSACDAPACRFLLCARTFNSLAAHGSPTSAEWLPGQPADAGMAGGRATFPDIAGGPNARASVGLASWSDHPLRVRLRAGPFGQTGSVRAVTVPAFGHLHIDLGAWTSEGRVEVDLDAGGGVARLFPYVSVVDGEGGTTLHLLPEEVSVRPPAGAPPMPRTSSSELTRDL